MVKGTRRHKLVQYVVHIKGVETSKHELLTHQMQIQIFLASYKACGWDK